MAMKRMTIRNSDWTVSQPTNLNWENVLYRLAAYEDTELDPEQVVDIKLSIMGKSIAEVKEFDGISIDRLRELAKAERDGRIVVLPCGNDAELTRNGYTFSADHWNHFLTAFRDAPENKSGKQIELFSISEVEEALSWKGGAR